MTEEKRTVTETTVESPAVPDRKEEHRLPEPPESKVVERTETVESSEG